MKISVDNDFYYVDDKPVYLFPIKIVDGNKIVVVYMGSELEPYIDPQDLSARIRFVSKIKQLPRNLYCKTFKERF